MRVSRRGALGLLASAAIPKGRRTKREAAGESSGGGAQTPGVHPSIARLRAIEIAEAIEPALVFRPRSG